MHTIKRFAVLGALALILVACGASPSNPVDTIATSSPTETNMPDSSEAGSATGDRWPDGQNQEDDQGAVSVMITPRNLNTASETIEFDVSLNTHSVDLSMDLASLSVLTTDTGLTVNALRWDAPSGGHHVSGVLSFPAYVNGTFLLTGATELTLTIRNLDAAERNFQWMLRAK